MEEPAPYLIDQTDSLCLAKTRRALRQWRDDVRWGRAPAPTRLQLLHHLEELLQPIEDQLEDWEG